MVSGSILFLLDKFASVLGTNCNGELQVFLNKITFLKYPMLIVTNVDGTVAERRTTKVRY